MNTNEITNTLVIFNHIYNLLYDAKIPECWELVEKGDQWIKEHPQELRQLVQARQDIFSSDREVNALALALGL